MKKFCIAIPHIQRRHSYILQTLESLFFEKALQNIVVVVCDFGLVRSADLEKAKEQFKDKIETGSMIIERFEGKSPNLSGLPRNFGDDERRVQWRSKQAWDAACLMERCSGLASYHIHLEDDVIAHKNYRTKIDALIDFRRGEWFSIKLSPQGATAIMINGQHLEKLSAFLKLLYDEMLLDWLINEFIALKDKTGLPSHVVSGCFKSR